MGKTITAKGKIVLEYLERYGDEVPSLTLAKIIAKECPLDFKKVDEARNTIRNYRGQLGEKNRAQVGVKKHFRDQGKVTDRFRIPKPESEDSKPLVLPLNCNNIGVISDLHMPNHRTKPIELALQYFLDNKCNCIVINGDLLDNTPFTRHGGKRPSAADVRRWFDQVETFLENLRETFPKAGIYWTEGNHDYWYRRWMNDHAWQLDDDPYFSLQERLHLEEYKIHWVPQTQYMLAGKLAIAHGHHVVKGIIAPVNAARGVFNRAKVSMMIGHVHVESSHTETDLHGNMVTTWSTGCLCTLTPEYQPMAGKACHGFAHVRVGKDGSFKVNNIRIDKGKMY